MTLCNGGLILGESGTIPKGAWKVFRDTGNNGPGGQVESILVPAGATAYLAAEIKLSSGFSGNRPYLFAKNANSFMMVDTMMEVQQLIKAASVFHTVIHQDLDKAHNLPLQQLEHTKDKL